MRLPTWLQTTLQILPRFAKVAREIQPTVHAASAGHLDPEDLVRRGYEALLWDVDGTLTSHHAGHLSPELEEPLRALFAHPGFRHAIVSNCKPDRFAELGRIFPQIPVFLGYETDAGPVFRILRGTEETWQGPGAERVREGAPHLGPLQKPSGELIRAALRELGVEDRPEAALMIGDQYFTDIASANLAGIASVKVPTLDRASFPGPVRFGQHLERVIYALLYGRSSDVWARR